MRPNGPVEWAILLAAVVLAVDGMVRNQLTLARVTLITLLVGLIWPQRVDRVRKERNGA